MAKNSGNEKYAYLDRLSTEQLEELLRADFESPESSSESVIFQILEVIEEREKEHPTGRLPDEDKAWAEFQQYYNIPEGENLSLYPPDDEDGEEAPADEEEEGPTSKQLQRTKKVHLSRVLRAAGIAAIVAVCTLGLMVGVQAAGINIFGAIGRWTDETFHFITSSAPIDAQQGTSDSSSSINQNDKAYYDLLQRALDNCGISEKLAPTIYPDGFEISELKASEVIFGDKIFCSFNGRREEFFSIQVLRYNLASDLNLHSFEKDGIGVTEYTTGGKTFYIMSNIDTTTATWSDGNSLVLKITGNILENDIEAMVDSIGG